ncbi:hypothetical protein DKP78_18995, partial [Enterococcus faecium]
GLALEGQRLLELLGDLKPVEAARLSLHRLVEGVLVGFVADAHVMLELSQSPHARPAVLVAHGQQQGCHRVVQLRH